MHGWYHTPMHTKTVASFLDLILLSLLSHAYHGTLYSHVYFCSKHIDDVATCTHKEGPETHCTSTRSFHEINHEKAIMLVRLKQINARIAESRE